MALSIFSLLKRKKNHSELFSIKILSIIFMLKLLYDYKCVVAQCT